MQARYQRDSRERHASSRSRFAAKTLISKGDDNLNSGSSLEVFSIHELNANHIGTESSPFEELGTDWNALPFINCRTRGMQLM
jgi:hypothetical protein